jgi:TRAP-type uncharacterized transport system substrate-binding protein
VRRSDLDLTEYLDGVRRRSWILFSVVTAAVIAILAAAVLLLADAERKITIGVGPVTSSGYAAAQQLAEGLAKRGFVVTVIPTDQTQDLIELLADPDSPIEVTFITEDIDAAQYPNVNSLGTVSRLPYAFATWPAAHGITSLAEARGKRIDVGPVGSSRAAFAEEVLGKFGITAQNSTFLNVPTSATLEEVKALDVEVQVTDDQDDRPFIVGALATEELRIIPVPEARALSNRIASAEAIEIPYASFSLVPPVPQEPFPSVAQLVTVVAVDSLTGAASYAIAQELTTVFSTGTAFTAPGEFPNFADRQLPVSPYAAEYYANGTVPWHFATLPPLLADYFFGLVFLGTLILVVASIWSILLPEVYSLRTRVFRPRSEARFISAMEESLEEGRELSPRDRSRLAKILDRYEMEDQLQARAERLRPHLE